MRFAGRISSIFRNSNGQGESEGTIMSSPSPEKQMSSGHRPENTRKEYLDPESGSALARNDLNQYFLRKGFTIDKFLEQGRRLVYSDDLHLLSLHTNDLLKKVEGISPFHYPGLDMAVHTIVLVLKSPRAKAAVDPLPKHLAEVAFAAQYFLRINDLGLDSTGEIGLAADNAVLKRVLARNQTELAKSVILPWT
jgi:hypothetical protein